jgi:hypothetical protein
MERHHPNAPRRARGQPARRMIAGRAQATAPFDALQAEAIAAVGGQSGQAARLLIQRLVQARPTDAAARSALDAMILGAWERLERRARERAGPDASAERVARELISYLGLAPD